MVILIVAAIYYLATQKPATEPEGAVPAPLEEPLKIGGIAPLTGDEAGLGIALQRAAEMAIAEINQAGGVLSQPIEMIWEDGKCGEREATAAVQKLINVDKVKFILGGVCPQESLVIAPVAESAKVITLSPVPGNYELTAKSGDYFFRTSPPAEMIARAAAEYAYNKLQVKKAAVILEKDYNSQALHDVFKERFIALGGEIAADEIFQNGDDLEVKILKVKQAEPKLVYLLPQSAASGAALVKEAKKAGLGAQLLTNELLIKNEVAAENGIELENLIGLEHFFDESEPKTAAFLAAYETKYEEKPFAPQYMANMYSQIYLIRSAVEAAGLDSDKLRGYLLSLVDWEEALGKLTFDQNGDRLGQYAVKKISNGKPVGLEVITPSL